jgi:hypothetical protein
MTNDIARIFPSLTASLLLPCLASAAEPAIGSKTVAKISSGF